VQLIAAMMY